MGPRSSGQASSSPIERSSHGHDLWNMKNSILAFMTVTLLGRILCTQSDKMLELSGNIIMMAAIMLENAKDRRSIGGHDNICFHKIVTMWFSSVSSYYGVLFYYPKIFPFLLTKEFEFYQSIHIDNNDRSSSFFWIVWKNHFKGIQKTIEPILMHLMMIFMMRLLDICVDIERQTEIVLITKIQSAVGW